MVKTRRYRSLLCPFVVASLLVGTWSRAFSQEARLTAMTFFGANEQGAVNPALRWNTLYPDAAWDIALWNWKDPGTVNWAADLMNNPSTYQIDIPLAVGEVRTFGFTVYGGPEVPQGYYGFNLFFDGRENPGPGAPGISVVAYTDADVGGAVPPYSAIAGTVPTMGWPIPDVGGSGTLVYLNSESGVKVTLTDAVIYAPEAYGVDLVVGQWGGQPATSGLDGQPDVIGKFTLKVEASAKPPSDLACSRSQDGKTADLSWTNNGAYASLKIIRNGSEIASLPVSSTSYRDTSVPIGKATYQVLAEFDGIQAGPSCTLADPAHGEVAITAITFFGTNDRGAVNPAYRWNTTYPDDAWDIAVFEGEAPPDVPVAWLNENATYGVNIRLLEGEERTFGFVVSGAGLPTGYFGLNLFFDGAQTPSPGTPGISVFADTCYAVGAQPEFRAIERGLPTMGWPIPDVPSSGTLEFLEPTQGLKVTLTDYVVYAQDVFALDVVQPQEPGRRRLTETTDGAPDLIGQFTIRVESAAAPPTELLCDRPGDGKTVDLSWKNNGTYGSLKILRDRKLLASLAVSATSYRDTNVPPGRHRYQVLAEIKGIEVGPSCLVLDPVNAEAVITAITLFWANSQGFVDIRGRWNTIYYDAAWDIGVFAGSAPPEEPVEWLNDLSDYSVELPIVAGEEKTFGFVVSGVAPNYYGLNLFFGGAQNPSPGTPGISVFAHSDDDGPGDAPPFEAIPKTSTTMGWPIADVPGAGTLVYYDDAQGLAVRLTEYVVYSPDVFALDLVQQQEPGGRRLTEAPDGIFDTIGHFTLKAEFVPRAPTNLSCSRSEDGKTVDMAWTNNGTYEALKVLRDGAEVAVLPGTATSYRETNAPPHTHTYQLVYVAKGDNPGPSCELIDPANPEVFLTALTLYGATEVGVVRIAERWNTLYLDAAWDIALYEGDLVTDPDEYDPTDPNFWLNDPSDMSIRIRLVPGQERTFSFHTGRLASDANFFGMNFFFDGAENPSPGKPGISVYAYTDVDGPEVGPRPLFQANSGNPTMGWPIANVLGAGTLVYEDTEKKLRVTLTDFVVYVQTAINSGDGIDLVQTQDPGGRLPIAAPDGAPDFVGQFTLRVESTGVSKAVFHRGDANADGAINITDGIFILNYLFLGGPEPPCMEAANANDDASLNITDGIYVLNYLFLGGPDPVNPGPVEMPCGPDPADSPTDLGCASYPNC